MEVVVDLADRVEVARVVVLSVQQVLQELGAAVAVLLHSVQ
jgi:hypothetical protein